MFKLKLKVIAENIQTGNTNIAVINKEDAEDLDLFAGDRVLLKYKKRRIKCIVDVGYSNRDTPKGFIVLYKESVDKLKVRNKSIIKVELAKRPVSTSLIKKKLSGKKLTKKEYRVIVEDIVNDNLSDIELTYFVAACSAHNLSTREVKFLIDAVVHTGSIIKPESKIVVDKHCVGGVAGNRTTMIVTPILAAAGYTVPKTSSKAITSPAGTANTMECLAKVELNEKQIKKVVKDVGACMVWGGALNLAPADDKIIRVEHPLSIDVSGLLLSSIMSKKISVSANHLLIDIPWGKGSKFPSKKDALALKKKFEHICSISKIKCKIVLTDGRSPIGHGLGPVLEAIDVMKVLRNDSDAPEDLKNKSVLLAGYLFELLGKCKKGKGKVFAERLIENGAALAKMNEIIDAQGKNKLPAKGKFTQQVFADKTGKVKKISNRYFSKLAKIAGAPKSLGAGVFISINLNDKVVKKNSLLFTIYAESESKLKFAHEFFTNNKEEFIFIK